MADETVVFEVEVKTDTDEVLTLKESLDEIEDSLRNLKKVDATAAAEKQFQQLNKIVDENVLSIQELGTAADNYKNIALAAGKESPIGQEALQKAADLERQMDLTNQAVTKLNDNGRLLGASLDVGTSVIAGYTALTGVQQLLGEENEQVLESMQKLQAAQSVLMGLQELRNALDREGVLVTTAKAAAEKTATVASKAMAGAQIALNAIMSANPIGLVVLAIGALTAGFLLFSDKIKMVMKVVLAPFILQFQLLKMGIEAVAEAFNIIPSAAERSANAAIEAARNLRIKTIEEEKKKLDAIIEAEEEKRKARTESFDFEIAKLRAAGEETYEIEQEKLRFVLESLAKQKAAIEERFALEMELADTIAQGEGALSAVIGGAAEIRKKQHKETMKEIEEQEKDAQETITINEITEQKKRRDEAQKAWEKRKADEEKRRADELKAQQEHHKKILDGQRELNASIREMNEERARSAQILKPPLMREAEEIPNAVQAILNGYGTIIEADTDSAQERIKNNENLKAALLSIEGSLFSATNSLIELSSKNDAEAEKKKKKLAIVELAINTAKGIAGAIAVGAQTGPFPANLPAIATGISVVLANMAQAKKILSKAGASATGISASVSGGGAATDIAQGVIQDNVGGEITTNTDDLINGNGNNNNKTQIVLPIETMTSGQQRLVQLEQQSTI